MPRETQIDFILRKGTQLSHGIHYHLPNILHSFHLFHPAFFLRRYGKSFLATGIASLETCRSYRHYFLQRHRRMEGSFLHSDREVISIILHIGADFIVSSPTVFCQLFASSSILMPLTSYLQHEQRFCMITFRVSKSQVALELLFSESPEQQLPPRMTCKAHCWQTYLPRIRLRHLLQKTRFFDDPKFHLACPSPLHGIGSSFFAIGRDLGRIIRAATVLQDTRSPSLLNRNPRPRIRTLIRAL